MKAAAKIRAESLRRQGVGIKEVARRVGVSQSTASRWCSGILLSPDQHARLDKRRRDAGIKALTPWIQKNRALKRADIEKQSLKGQRDVSRVTKRDLLMVGLGLYWGEGYKRGSQEWGFTNSDPAMIRVVLRWLREYYDVSVERIIARLTINQRYQRQTERLASMWTRETGIPRVQFAAPTFIGGYDSSKLNERSYRGTLRIKVRRGTSLRRRILASIAEIERQSASNSRNTLS